MVHLRGMVLEGWYMIQDSKLWYDYIIMVQSGNAVFDNMFCITKNQHKNKFFEVRKWSKANFWILSSDLATQNP